MEPTLLPPSRARKRAAKACLACRARKVRCDVSQRGRPCANCYLDHQSCVVVGRASRRRKSNEVEGNTNGVHKGLAQGSQEVEEAGMSPDQALDIEMGTVSDVGSDRDEAQDSNVPQKPDAAPTDHRLDPGARPTAAHFAPRDDDRVQQTPCSTGARLEQLRWTGEHSMSFGSDVTFSYYPFLEANNLHNILPQDVSYLELQGCFRVPIKTLMDEFVKQYFLYIHPMTPILNEGRVWEMYGAQPAGPDRLSLLVCQAVLFSACSYVPNTMIAALGFADTNTARSAFYRRAKLLFDFGVESSPVAISQAALLLSSWTPFSSSHCSQDGSFWLDVAIKQAKMAGAHRYHSPIPALTESYESWSRQRNRLKRLWWCIILHDRLLSLSARKPIQVTAAHYGFDSQPHRPLGLRDLQDEVEHSRVYNPGTKKSLIGVCAQMMKLAVALTDALTAVCPTDELPQWHKFSQENKDVFNKSRTALMAWAEQAALELGTPGADDPREPAPSLANSRDTSKEFTHDSIVLFSNLAYLVYFSATVQLCHRESLLVTNAATKAEFPGTPCQGDDANGLSRHAMSGTITCLNELAKSHLLQRLPFNSMSFISLPIILQIAYLKLSPHPSTNSSVLDLDNLDEAVRGYQPSQDTTDCVSREVRRILDRSNLDELQRLPAQNDVKLQPGPYFRMSLALAFGKASSMTDLVAQLPLILSCHYLRAAKSMIEQRSEPGPVSPTLIAGSLRRTSSSTQGDVARQRMAAWMQHDQAISLGVEQGIVPPGLAAEEEIHDVVEDEDPELNCNVESDRVADENARWKQHVNLAFSEIGDVLEGRLLDTFNFRE